jgi:hypothetical protein
MGNVPTDKPNARDNGPMDTLHASLLEAMRSREQEILQFLAIIAPAVGGFVYLVYKLVNWEMSVFVFALGVGGIVSVLFVGCNYCAALAYNYRTLVRQLVATQEVLGITDAIQGTWPRTPADCNGRAQIGHAFPWILALGKKVPCLYALCKRVVDKPWCDPPESVKVFWRSFLVVMATLGLSMVVVWLTRPECFWQGGVFCLGVLVWAMLCIGFSLRGPWRYGCRFAEHSNSQSTEGEE